MVTDRRVKNQTDRRYQDFAQFSESEERVWSLYKSGVAPVRIAEMLGVKPASVRTKIHLIKEKIEDAGLDMTP